MAKEKSEGLMLRELAESGKWKDLAQALSSKEVVERLNPNSLRPLGDLLIENGRKAEILKICKAGTYKEVFARWIGITRKGGELVNKLGVEWLFALPEENGLRESAEMNVAERVTDGEYELWPSCSENLNSLKLVFSSLEKDWGSPNQGEALWRLLIRKLDGETDTPSDFEAMALSDAKRAQFWNPTSKNPDVTQNGTLSRANGADWTTAIHEAALKDDPDMLDLMRKYSGPEEYGITGFDSIDTILQNFSLKCFQRLVDKDPTMIFRKRVYCPNKEMEVFVFRGEEVDDMRYRHPLRILSSVEVLYEATHRKYYRTEEEREETIRGFIEAIEEAGLTTLAEHKAEDSIERRFLEGMEDFRGLMTGGSTLGKAAAGLGRALDALDALNLKPIEMPSAIERKKALGEKLMKEKLGKARRLVP